MLEVRRPKNCNEPKQDIVTETPQEPSMDVLPDDDEFAGAPDIGGGDDPIDLDDTTDFYGKSTTTPWRTRSSLRITKWLQ